MSGSHKDALHCGRLPAYEIGLTRFRGESLFPMRIRGRGHERLSELVLLIGVPIGGGGSLFGAHSRHSAIGENFSGSGLWTPGPHRPSCNFAEAGRLFAPPAL